MPELPEVETVVRDLRPLVLQRPLLEIRTGPQSLRRKWNPQASSRLLGARFLSLERRGKWILAGFDVQPMLLIHLGMTGQLTVTQQSDPLPDHLHFQFLLDLQQEIRFRDIRRFGSVDLFPDRQQLQQFLDARLGPEPFGLDPIHFRERVQSTSRCLKALLLDQKLVAGVGNIYADEACFRAGLHPAQTGQSLSPKEIERLRLAIEAVLTKAIENRGSTIRNYVGGSGLMGQYQNEFQVYGRTHQPCPRCGTTIEVIRLAGRSSHYCPKCQKRKSARLSDS